jgi:site-specific recombinase XerD
MITVKNIRGQFKTKSGHERGVSIAGELKEVLARLDEERRAAGRTSDDEHVFLSSTGQPIHPKVASHRFKFFLRLADLPKDLRFHSLRHTTASWLVQDGVALYVVKGILGHADVKTTQNYAHLAPDVMKAAMDSTFTSR